MVLCFSNNVSSIGKDMNLLLLSLSPSYTLKVLTYLLILGNIKTNGHIISSKYSIKYLKLSFFSINFETTVLSTLMSQFFFSFLLHHKTLLLLLLSYQMSTILYYRKKMSLFFSYLIQTFF